MLIYLVTTGFLRALVSPSLQWKAAAQDGQDGKQKPLTAQELERKKAQELEVRGSGLMVALPGMLVGHNLSTSAVEAAWSWTRNSYRFCCS
jgi:hypothetical protein